MVALYGYYGYGYYYDPMYILIIISCVIALIAQVKVKSTFNKYSRVSSSKGMTGAMVAEQLLRSQGIYDVSIQRVSGSLTDNYDPRTKVLSLSEDVYGVNSVSAVSVACHEAGHAIQHARGYIPLKIRNGIVPVVNFASKLTWPLLLIGIVLLAAGSFEMSYWGNMLFNIGVIAFIAIIVFHLITLPVEFNASHRAIVQMEQLALVAPEDIVGSKKVLRAAAMTYIAALAVAVANLLRILAIRGRSD